MPPRMTPPIDKLAREALEEVAARVPRRLITRNGTKLIEEGGVALDGKPYLYRSYLDGGKAEESPEGTCGILLHKFVSSDEIGELHNHPWKWAVSFILAGSYYETRGEGTKADRPNHIILRNKLVREFKGGDVNFIRDVDFHRVELITPEVWTLFLHGPRISTWGFARDTFDEPVRLTTVTKRTFDLRPEIRKR